MDQQGWGQPPQGDPQQQQQWGQPQGGQQPAPGGAAPGWFAQAAAQWPAPSEEDKQHAFFAHLFPAVANILCCGVFFPFLAALIPLAMTKTKHPFVMFHINQSFLFGVALYIANVVFYLLGFLGNFLCIGWLLYPVNAILVLASIIYPIIVGLKAKDGLWEKYAFIGDKVLAMQSPLFK